MRSQNCSNDRTYTIRQCYNCALKKGNNQCRYFCVGCNMSLTRIPWYFPLSRKGTTSLKIACAMVMSPPPPIPVMARKIISCRAVCANEAAREPKKKMPSALRRTYLRDHISENRPYSNWNDVDVLDSLSILLYCSKRKLYRK